MMKDKKQRKRVHLRGRRIELDHVEKQSIIGAAEDAESHGKDATERKMHMKHEPRQKKVIEGDNGQGMQLTVLAWA
jgi:hypothetical protein